MTFDNDSTTAADNSTVSNATVTFANVPWLFGTAFFLLACVVSLAFNGIGLYYFLSNRQARSPFDWYLITLMVANICYTLSVSPFNVVDLMFTGWALDGPACTCYMYTVWIAQCFVPLIHLCISINRFWAVYYPVHYRQHISSKLVMWSAFMALVVTHVILVPYLYYSYFEKGWAGGVTCDIDYTVLPVYGNAVMYFFGWVPAALMYLLFPFIAVKIGQKLAKTSAGSPHSKVVSGKTVTTSAAGQQEHAPEATQSATAPVQVDPAAATSIAAAESRAKEKVKRERLMLSLYVLSFLVVSTLVCWAPLNVATTMSNYTDAITPDIIHICEILYYLQTVVDPLCFVFVMPEIRQKFRGWRQSQP